VKFLGRIIRNDVMQGIIGGFREKVASSWRTSAWDGKVPGTTALLRHLSDGDSTEWFD
jgi:hypothetical protein